MADNVGTMQLSITLGDDAATDLAEFYGYNAEVPATDSNGNILFKADGSHQTTDNPQSAADYLSDRIKDGLQNSVKEQRNRRAIAAAQNAPAPDVTVDVTEDAPAEATS